MWPDLECCCKNLCQLHRKSSKSCGSGGSGSCTSINELFTHRCVQLFRCYFSL